MMTLDSHGIFYEYTAKVLNFEIGLLVFTKIVQDKRTKKSIQVYNYVKQFTEIKFRTRNIKQVIVWFNIKRF